MEGKISVIVLAYGDEKELIRCIALGYKEKDAQKVKKALAEEQLTTDEYLRRALKLLMKK